MVQLKIKKKCLLMYLFKIALDQFFVTEYKVENSKKGFTLS